MSNSVAGTLAGKPAGIDFMHQRDTLERLALGALAGLVGTVILQTVRSAKQKVAPEAEPPIKQDPGTFMVQQAEKVLPAAAQPSSSKVESTAGQVLGLGYGMTFGSLYSSLAPSRTQVARDGVLLGLATWAAGYLGWLPATGLMSPVWEHRSAQLWSGLAEHAVYGLVTAASYRWLMDQVELS